VLKALDLLLRLDGSDALAAEARELCGWITNAIADDTLRRRFGDSEVVQRIGQL